MTTNPQTIEEGTMKKIEELFEQNFLDGGKRETTPVTFSSFGAFTIATFFYEQGRQSLQDEKAEIMREVRQILGMTSRRITIGENEYAMKQLGVTMAEIKEHNLEAEAYNEGYKKASEDYKSKFEAIAQKYGVDISNNKK